MGATTTAATAFESLLSRTTSTAVLLPISIVCAMGVDLILSSVDEIRNAA